MQITIATGLYPPEIGGPATYAVMLENELPRYGFTVKTVPFGLVRNYPKVVRHVVYTWKLWQASRGSKVIYALDPISVGLPALLVAKMKRKIFLLRVPGDYAWEQGQLRFGVTDRFHDFIEKRYEYGWRVSILCWLESFVARQAVRVIVPSHYMAKAIEKWGVDSENIQAIYSALHPLPVTDKREDLRNRMSLSFPTIISAGRLVPNKGFIEVINSFSLIKKTYPQAVLLVAGDGPQLPALTKQAEEKGVTQSVRFLGRLSKDEMGAAIKAADVFVLNTAHEGLSHQILEVMDIGTPIVTTDVGGNPELIKNGVNGYLVQYDNVSELTEATLCILNNPESRERMVQCARASSKQFAKEVVMQEIISVFARVHKKV